MYILTPELLDTVERNRLAKTRLHMTQSRRTRTHPRWFHRNDR